MPCCRIESISSCSASRAKFLRGCSALGMMVAKLIWCTLSPDSPVSARVATDGVPINAPSPLPRPDRAMRLRLREQFHQRKQLSVQEHTKQTTEKPIVHNKRPDEIFACCHACRAVAGRRRWLGAKFLSTT